MGHNLGEDGNFGAALGFVFVAFDVARFVEAGESLGEVEEVVAD